MNCPICRQAKIVDGLTSVMLERGEMRQVVNNVPARVCPKCREAYVDSETAVQLLRGAEEVLQTGMRADVIEYHDLQNE